MTIQQRFDAPDEHLPMDGECRDAEPHPESGAARPNVARLPGIATQLIGQRMRSMYAQMVCEPVPEEFLELVRQLESKEGPDDRDP